MLRQIAKRAALSLIRTGVRVPDDAVERFQEFTQLKMLLDALGINCVFDVGANCGQTVETLRGMGYRGHIFSFEPVGSAFAALTEWCWHDPRWKGFQMALGSENTSLSMNVVPQSTVISSLLNPLDPPAGMRCETVEVRRLDDLFASLTEAMAEPRVFLKMDTQGYDLQVFQGAEGCLEHVLGLQSEVAAEPAYEGAPSYLDTLRAYEDAGFKLQHLSTVSRTHEGGIEEMNCLMRRSID